MAVTLEIVARCVAGALAFVLALVAQRADARGARRRAAAACLGAAALGVAGFLNFGRFHHSRDATFVNQWEHFHYQLGSKYFPELGYDGLYLASLAAQRETHPATPAPPIVRDLATNRLATIPADGPAVAAVRDRFTAARWRAFRADHAHYLERNPPEILAEVRRDHGYNPSPAWTFVARIFAAPLTSASRDLGILASLDLLVMAVAFGVVFATCGLRAGALALALFGLSFGTRYVHLGSFLRLDWLAALLVGLCLLRRERFGSAGALLGYAAAVRIFPAVFLAGPALLAGKALLRGERPRGALRLAGGFALALSLGVAAGALAGRGPAAWGAFAQRIAVHSASWPTTRVGLDALVVHGPALARASLAEGLPPHFAWPGREEIERRLEARRRVRIALKAAGVALVGAALWSATLVEASVLGLALLFVLTTAESYYWVALCAAPLALRPRATLATLALGPLLYATMLLYPAAESGHLRYVWMSVGLAALLLYWLAPAAAEGLSSSAPGTRRRWPGAPPR